MSAILEIKDGAAVGPIHLPAPKNPPEGPGGFSFQPDSPPLEWVAVCGAVGYVYEREPLELLYRGAPVCQVCATGRPLCRCHGIPMQRNGRSRHGRARFRCPVQNNKRMKLNYALGDSA